MENRFNFALDEEKVNAEAALDGIYVIRTSLADQSSAEDAVRHYKALSQVERAFRSIKTMDLEVRPIHHYQEQRVRVHLFLCMLAYYVKWHMMAAWKTASVCRRRSAGQTAERSGCRQDRAGRFFNIVLILLGKFDFIRKELQVSDALMAVVVNKVILLIVLDPVRLAFKFNIV